MKSTQKKSEYREQLHRDMGVYLTEKRVKAGLTQKEVAMKMKYTSSQFISNIERGLAFPSDEVLKEMIRMYGIDKNELLETISELKMKYYQQALF